MTISCIRTHHLRSKLDEPFGFSQWSYDTRNALLVEVISDHHEPREGEINWLTELVMVANNLCKQAEIGQSGNPVEDDVLDELPPRLGINPQLLTDISNALPGELEKAMDFLRTVEG